METTEFIKNNFLGMSHESQRILLETLANTLNEFKKKKLSKKFNNVFLDYYEKINSLSSFKELYNSFNSDKRRLTRRIVLEELIKQVDNHHIDNSDKRIIQQFLYSSKKFTEQCKLEEYIRYFQPKNVSSEMVQKFLVEYSKLNIANKLNFIEEMNLYYDRLDCFNLPISKNILREYRPIIQELIGDEFIEYYDCLHSKEQMKLIINVIDCFNWFKLDNNYYNRILLEMREDPKFIRKLKKEAIYSCSHILNKN